VWISPHPERAGEAIRVLREAGVAEEAHVFEATRSGLADVRVMVAAAWDLSAIEEQYEQFIGEFRATAAADPLARQVELVHTWRRFPAIDPGLPRELLPAQWSGLTAARLFADRRLRWSGDALREWKRLNDVG
jgi:phenylacetic acid degradation operon negative regulatory protein